MATTLWDFMPLLLPRISDRLLPAAARLRIEEIAARLPPLGWGGFECTLGNGRPRVDLHQGLAEPRALARLLASPRARQAGREEREAWAGISRFADRWAAQAEGVGARVGEAGVEFDMSPDRATPPAIFWTIRLPTAGGRITDSVRGTIECVLGGPLARERARVLERVAEACADACTIPAAGIMLSRDAAPIRLNVWGLDIPAIPPFLHACGWEDPGGTCLQETLTRIGDCTDAVTLALTLGDTLLPGVGLECAPLRSGAEVPDWERTLTAWVASGYLSAAECQALLLWPGQVAPATSAGPWPGSLMAERLAGARGEEAFHCTLSHIKVGYRGDGGSPVKGYLAFLHAREHDPD